MNTRVINERWFSATPDRVYALCIDLPSWPTVFETVHAMHVVEHTPDDVTMEMHVRNALGDNTVVSRRVYDRVERSIEFSLEKLPPGLRAMSGSWEVLAEGEGATLRIIHDMDTDSANADFKDRIYATTDAVMTEMALHLSRESGQREPLPRQRAGKFKENQLAPETVATCEPFFARMQLGGLVWGDVVQVLHGPKALTKKNWPQWHRLWSAHAEHFSKRAGQARQAGQIASQRHYLLKAAACYHFAEFMFFDSPSIKEATRERVTECFNEAMPLLAHPIEAFTTHYGDMSLPGYVMCPEESGPRPTVFLLNGLDSAKEVELYAFARRFLERGMTVVLFDGPGQGLLAGKAPMEVEFEWALEAVFEDLASHRWVDPENAGLFGVSFGGYLSGRCAAKLPGLFKACINLSGGYDHDNYPEMNPTVRKDFRYVFGKSTEEEMAAFAREHINLRTTAPLSVPLLCVHGEFDHTIPFETCQRMLEWAEGEKELIFLPGERHVCVNHLDDVSATFADWMAAQIGCVETELDRTEKQPWPPEVYARPAE